MKGNMTVFASDVSDHQIVEAINKAAQTQGGVAIFADPSGGEYITLSERDDLRAILKELTKEDEWERNVGFIDLQVGDRVLVKFGDSVEEFVVNSRSMDYVLTTDGVSHYERPRATYHRLPAKPQLPVEPGAAIKNVEDKYGMKYKTMTRNWMGSWIGVPFEGTSLEKPTDHATYYRGAGEIVSWEPLENDN